MRRSLALQQQLVDSPEGSRLSRELAASHVNLGLLLAAENQEDQAAEEYRQAAELQQELVDEFPRVADYLDVLATTHTALGLLRKRQNRGDEAAEQYNRAQILQQRLADKFPSVPDYREDGRPLTSIWGKLLAEEHGDRPRRSRIPQDPGPPPGSAADEFPAVPAVSRGIGTHPQQSRVAVGTSEPGRSGVRAVQPAPDSSCSLLPSSQVRRLPRDLAGIQQPGSAAGRAGRFDQSVSQFRQAQEPSAGAVRRVPRDTAYREDLANSCNNLGAVLRASAG